LSPYAPSTPKRHSVPYTTPFRSRRKQATGHCEDSPGHGTAQMVDALPDSRVVQVVVIVAIYLSGVYGGYFAAAQGILIIGILGRSEGTRLNSSHVSISYAVFCLK